MDPSLVVAVDQLHVVSTFRSLEELPTYKDRLQQCILVLTQAVERVDLLI